MAYSDSLGDNAQLLRRTVGGVTDFAGRSRRTEVIYYWIATALVSVVLSFAVVTIAPVHMPLLFSEAVRLIVLIPMFALFVRRLHDQDRSGWWGLLLPAHLLLSIPRLLAEVRGDVGGIIAKKASVTGMVADLCALAVIVLCLWPGSDGENRYGLDPRLEEV